MYYHYTICGGFFYGSFPFMYGLNSILYNKYNKTWLIRGLRALCLQDCAEHLCLAIGHLTYRRYEHQQCVQTPSLRFRSDLWVLEYFFISLVKHLIICLGIWVS